MNSRRTFMAGAGAAVSSVVSGKAAPSDKIRIAVLGVNGRGKTTSRASWTCRTPKW